MLKHLKLACEDAHTIIPLVRKHYVLLDASFKNEKKLEKLVEMK